MVYELVVVCTTEAPEGAHTKLAQSLSQALGEGEFLIQDDWGRLKLPLKGKDGRETARFFYYLYKAQAQVNEEITRRLGLDESVLKFMIVKLGPDPQAPKILKDYRSPFSQKQGGSRLDDFEEKGADVHKDRQKFSRRRACWFTVKNVRANWKDPGTYSWLINDFGKISPARVSGVSRKHQRWANLAIKQARALGLVGHLSNRLATSVSSS